MDGKIALEEHFAIPETLADSEGFFPRDIWAELKSRLLEIPDRWLREMDAHGIELVFPSLNAPAVQAIPDRQHASEIARRANDFLAEQVNKRPDRFQGLAALPMQDPDAAARELARCVQDLGFRGALVNGFSQVDEASNAVYYDVEMYRPFWSEVERLDVPFYLHPRNPLPEHSQIYDGHPWLLGPTWGFGQETAVHALRLMASGLFDAHPRLRIILGHLGDGLPYSMWRADNRNAWMKLPTAYPAKRPLSEYFRENFYLTTSGNFRTQSLIDSILEIGADRIMFSADWPFENFDYAADWFDAATISEADRLKMGRTNALKLFKIGEPMAEQRKVKHWIGGAWVGSPSEKQSVNPATGAVIGRYCDGGAEVAQAAIEAAARAFRQSAWAFDPMLRAAALSHMADAYAARLGDVIDALCSENGKVRYEATFEAQFIIRGLRFAAGLALQNFGRVVDPRPGQQSMSIRQPVGVAGLIIPWNSPAYLCIRALAPALAAGCTAVVKLPGQAAQIAALHSEIIAGVAEIPAGVVNIFVESGAEGARLLVDSPLVPTISFTGSTHTGRLIAQAAAKQLKRVGLELGGKTPHLVFDDADLNAVLPVLEKSSTVFAGQFCMTGSRILVQRGMADTLKGALAQRLEKVRPGPASDAESDMGPLIDKAAVARVDRAVEEAIQAGATAIVRGGPTTVAALAGGAFYHPTLLEITDASLPIARTETFGPVQTLHVFDTEDEAVELANDSEYGLSACIWSRDVDRPMRVARRLEAGLISINSWANLAVEFEEGGFKSSGLGRLGGLASLEDFVEYKQITQNYDGGH